MKEKIVILLNKILPKWLKESNRTKHLLYAIPIGFLFTILCVLGVASGMEFKDKAYGGKWDWLDWSSHHDRWHYWPSTYYRILFPFTIPI